MRQIFAGLKENDVNAVIVASPDLQTNHPRLIIKLSEDARLPVVGHREAWVEWGALLSYSTDADTAGPVAARYIDKIFKGANPADLPVEELSRIPMGNTGGANVSAMRSMPIPDDLRHLLERHTA